MGQKFSDTVRKSWMGLYFRGSAAEPSNSKTVGRDLNTEWAFGKILHWAKARGLDLVHTTDVKTPWMPCCDEWPRHRARKDAK